MELTLNRKNFLAAVDRVIDVTKARSTVPVLGHVLVDVTAYDVRLSATDLEIGITTSLSADGASRLTEPAAFTLHAAKLHDILKASDSETVTIRSLDHDWYQLVAGRAKFKLMGLDPRSFPAMPAPENSSLPSASLTIAAEVLCKMIDRTIFAVSPDEARYNLAGIYLTSTEGGVRMVATDGHRIAIVEREAPGFVSPKNGVIVPRKAMAVMRKMLADVEADVTLNVNGLIAGLTTADSSLTCRLVEGEFPDYTGVIPKEEKVKIVVHRDAWLAALKRTLLMANEKCSGIKISFGENELSLSSTAPEVGEAHETLDVNIVKPDKPFDIGFNGKYLMDVLSVLPESSLAVLSLIDEKSAAKITTDSDMAYQYIAMPVRL